MLKDWQEKFPRSFAPHPFLFDLPLLDQDMLCQLFQNFEAVETNILDEALVKRFLDNLAACSNPTEELTQFKKLFTPENISLMTENLSSAYELISHLICFTIDKLNAEGLSDTLSLLKIAELDPLQESIETLSALTRVLGNPLCQTIFNARLRCFSDYSSPSEPLSANHAAEIIAQLTLIDDYDHQIQFFFDTMTAYRPFPPSQKYIVDINMKEEVNTALCDFCQSLIKDIATYEDYEKTVETINKLRNRGGNITIFNAIKYEVATRIESEDYCSTRDYKTLMDDIWLALSKPQKNLDTFKGELKATRQQFATLSLSMQSMFYQQPSKEAHQTTPHIEFKF